MLRFVSSVLKNPNLLFRTVINADEHHQSNLSYVIFKAFLALLRNYQVPSTFQALDKKNPKIKHIQGPVDIYVRQYLENPKNKVLRKVWNMIFNIYQRRSFVYITIYLFNCIYILEPALPFLLT